MPDYSCLFVFREADRDFEIKARNPDKADPRDILVFLRILKGVNLLWASLSRLARLFAHARDCFRENWFRIFVERFTFFGDFLAKSNDVEGKAVHGFPRQTDVK